MDFTKDEMIHLKATLPKGLENRLDPIWMKAFSSYNGATKENLQMTCRPCYQKVYNFLEFLTQYK